MSEFLCLASVGRSGSTFLQRLLNTHPDVVLFGEHEGFLSGVRSAFAKLAAPRTTALITATGGHLSSILRAEPIVTSPGGWSTEWTNALRPHEVAPAFASFVKNLIYPPHIRSPSHRYWGFKEIRYGAEDLGFCRSLFPNGRFLLLVRNPVEVFRSQCRLGWGLHVGATEAAAQFHRAFSSLSDAWGALRGPDGVAERAQLVCYERLAADPLRHLDLIARWLDLGAFDETKALAVASAQLTPGPERWTPEMQAFLDAYVEAYAEGDLQRYAAMSADALDVQAGQAEAAAPIVVGSGQVRIAWAPHGDPVPPGQKAAVPHDDGAPIRIDRGAAANVPRLRRGFVGGGPDRGRKLVFLHLPRTGGTTLREQIALAFEPSDVCPYRFGIPKGCPAEELDRYRFFSGHFTFDDVRRIPGEKYVFTVLRDPRDRLLSIWRASQAVARGAFGEGDRSGSEPGHGPEGRPFPYANDMVRRLVGTVTVDADGTYLNDAGDAAAPLTGIEAVRLALTNLASLDFVGFIECLDTAYAQVAQAFGLPQAAGTLPRRNASAQSFLSCWGDKGEAHGMPMSREDLERLTELDEMLYAMARLRLGRSGEPSLARALAVPA